MSQTFSIAELSREFGVTPRALRFYEDKGLINPTRRGTTRLYSERDKTRLKLTLRGKRLGLTLEECINIIDMHKPDQPNDTLQLLHLCQKVCDHRTLLIEKIRDIEETLKAMDEVENKCLAQLLENTTSR